MEITRERWEEIIRQGPWIAEKIGDNTYYGFMGMYIKIDSSLKYWTMDRKTMKWERIILMGR